MNTISASTTVQNVSQPKVNAQVNVRPDNDGIRGSDVVAGEKSSTNTRLSSTGTVGTRVNTTA